MVTFLALCFVHLTQGMITKGEIVVCPCDVSFQMSLISLKVVIVPDSRWMSNEDKALIQNAFCLNATHFISDKDSAKVARYFKGF